MKISFFTLLTLASALASARERDLVAAADVKQLVAASAAVARDTKTGALKITFAHAAGEPEVRIPVAKLGWPTDWSSYKSIQYTFHASTLEPVSIAFSDGKQEKAFLTEPLPGIRIYGVIPFDVFVQTRTMVPANPVGYKAWPQRLFTFNNVQEVVFRMRYPNQASTFTLYNFTLRDDVPADDILDKKPMIDRYGQWIPEEWPGKVHDERELRKAWGAGLAPASYPFCPLGGDINQGHGSKASGFFRVEQKNGRWTFIDPHGHAFFSAGMDLVGYDQGSFATDVTRREYLFERLPPRGLAWVDGGKHPSFYVANIMQRFGDGWQEKWTAQTLARLRNWGFNTIANWSDKEIATRSGMPYVLPLSGWTTKKMFPFPWDFPDVFSKEFEANVDAAARAQVSALKNDPNLIGWFIGNEPHWARGFGSLTPWPDMLLSDPEPSATKAKLQELLKANPGEEKKVKDAFVYTCARRYFEVIRGAIKRHDPNHLVLGIRFAENPNDRWLELSRIFDVFSINIYSKTFMPDPKEIRRYAEVSGKPVLIGEFTACAPGRGLQGLFYWSHKVRDQNERAKAYRYYVENAAADPAIIGTHWFQMVDDLPTGRPSDEERLNYGFINVLDLPYPELVEAAKRTHSRIYQLKFGTEQPFADSPSYN